MATRPFFTTPQEAEAAFYDALERADLEAMMGVWAEDEEIVCTHPGGVRLVGSAAVRESWRQIFQQARKMQVRCSGEVRTEGLMLAVSWVMEQFFVPGEARNFPPVTATNVYHKGSEGWRMLSHHASPVPIQQEATEDGPRILH